jgi:nitric oxide reductase NorD protein
LEEQRRQRGEPRRFEVRRAETGRPESLELELLLDERPVAPPEAARNLLSSILLDLDEIPPEYLLPAGPGEYDPTRRPDREVREGRGWAGSLELEGLFHYPEWDHRCQHYHKNWCTVREVELEPLDDGFAAETLERHGPLVGQLRRTFEAMRDEDRLLKRQPDGDGVDIDALVEALADARRGFELGERLFTRLHRAERNIAVAFMVDMSGSTKGWINQAEREALLLLCEALESLDDRYAIYGFSGESRNRCEIYAIKHFHQPYDEAVRGRIGAIRAKDYTRMGFAIRHLSAKLRDTDARSRMLITLSDGKPDDLDGYRGEYGIEDTRRALIEARRAGIHPYCITIDEQARDYLPHLYGPAAYTVVDRVRDLPFKVSEVYRRLTR